jgi:PadR family transcriptional regulator PadR
LSFRHGESGHKKGRHDFWREWNDERRRRWHAHGPGFPPPIPPLEMAHAWREFFSEFMGGASPEDHWFFGGRRFSPWHQGMDTFNPFVATLLSKGGGLLPLYVMQLVAQKPRYGNEIMEIIAERTGGQWVSNPGAIYPLLNLLEEQHLIEGAWEDPQKRTIRIYSLTEKGAQELARLKAIVHPKLTEAIKVMQGLEHDLSDDEAVVE